MQWLGILLTVALLAMAPGYGSAQPAGEKGSPPATQPKGLEEQGTPARPAKSYTLKERQAYQQKVAQDLAKLGQRIDDLHGSYENIRPQMKRQALRMLHSLKQQQMAAQTQLAALEKALATDWGRLKVEIDKTMQQLTQACKDAESRLE